MAGEADAKTLEERLRLIEDRFEIYNLIASHPPSADTGASDYTASVWTEDGVFDRGAEFARPSGDRWRLVEPRAPPGDRARDRAFRRVALCEDHRRHGVRDLLLQILVPERVGPMFDVPNHGSSRGFHVHRVSANRWEFVRTGEGWKIKSRRLRPLDGTEPARDILSGALKP